MRRVITIDIDTLPSDELETDPKTALSGDFGRILCIGFADEDRAGLVEGVIGWDDETQSFPVDEPAMLEEFRDRMRGFRLSVGRVDGHSVFDFDLKFTLKRSIVHGVKPSVDMSFARCRNQAIFDTMQEREQCGFTSRISLDKLARARSVLLESQSKNQGGYG